MGKLLYIKASPRGGRSYSVAVANAFVEAYRQAHPAHEVAILDLYNRDLPPFDGAAVSAKYAVLHGQKPTPEEQKRWREVETWIKEFTSADKYLFAVPMWNFGIPYRLKHYFDLIVQPGYTFSFSPDAGYQGLVSGKPALLVLARGGEYPEEGEAAAFDLQKKYLDLILRFIGFREIASILVEPTMGGKEKADEVRERAVRAAQSLAREF